MGEAIKYGCIRSAELFEAISGGVKGPQLDSMIAACIDIKRQVVERDEFDRGERMLLNFGHTFGHALEKYYGFGKHTHGEAVGMGMVMMARAGEAQGITEPGTAEKSRARSPGTAFRRMTPPRWTSCSAPPGWTKRGWETP